MKSPKRKIGDLGEDLACTFLMKQGFEIIERNYLRKWGEIDVVAKKGRLLHFIEVKSARLASTSDSESRRVNHETRYRAEDNMHPWKLKRLSRIIQTYLLHKKHEGEWQLDLITVKLDMDKRQGHVEMMENIVI